MHYLATFIIPLIALAAAEPPFPKHGKSIPEENQDAYQADLQQYADQMAEGEEYSQLQAAIASSTDATPAEASAFNEASNDPFGLGTLLFSTSDDGRTPQWFDDVDENDGALAHYITTVANEEYVIWQKYASADEGGLQVPDVPEDPEENPEEPEDPENPGCGEGEECVGVPEGVHNKARSTMSQEANVAKDDPNKGEKGDPGRDGVDGKDGNGKDGAIIVIATIKPRPSATSAAQKIAASGSLLGAIFLGLLLA